MTEKEKQAKLQYLLNSLSMTKEQKDIVVDLVNSSGNGGGGANVKRIYIDQDPDTSTTRLCLSIDDITTDYAAASMDSNTLYVNSTKFVNKMYEYVSKNYMFDLCLMNSVIFVNSPIVVNCNDSRPNISIIIGDMTFHISKD